MANTAKGRESWYATIFITRQMTARVPKSGLDEGSADSLVQCIRGARGQHGGHRLKLN